MISLVMMSSDIVVSLIDMPKIDRNVSYRNEHLFGFISSMRM